MTRKSLRETLRSTIFAVTLDLRYIDLVVCIRPFYWIWWATYESSEWGRNMQVCIGPFQFDLDIPAAEQRCGGFYIATSFGVDGPFTH